MRFLDYKNRKEPFIMENMKEFLDSFYEKMKKRGKIYDKEEKKNFENLYNALENNDYVGIQIFALGMGDGKSTFIQEYCKYKMKLCKYAC